MTDQRHLASLCFYPPRGLDANHLPGADGGMTMLQKLAVIIPVAPGDRAWVDLVADLKRLPLDAEILFAGPLPIDALRPLFEDLASDRNVRWLQAAQGRGCQLNAGVKATHKPYLWFLHADSRFNQPALAALERSLKLQPTALHYFNLRFLDDGPALTKVNAIGVWLRSHLFGLPFGDQGFCLRRSLFERLNGFREDAPYGEDHLLVWQARFQGIPLCCTGKTLQTSARKYRDYGWWPTTLNHLILTTKQAFPEWSRLLSARVWVPLNDLGWAAVKRLKLLKRGAK